MKGKAIIPLVLGLCVGLVAVKLLVDTLKKAQASSAASQMVEAVRAKQDIDAYTEIKPEMVEVIKTSDSRFAPANDRVSSLDALLKPRARVTSKAIPQGSPVLLSMLAPEGTQAGMEGRIPQGFRAVSVEIDEVTGVAYQMKPGDWVDVIVVMDVDSGGGKRNKETIAESILDRVQVAAIGQATTGKPGDGASKVKAAKSATLLIPEEEVPKLHLAQSRGKITLAMRGDDDTTKSVGASAHSNDLLTSMKDAFAMAQAQAAASKPAATPTPQQPAPVIEKPADPPHAVAVFRGSAMPMAQPNVQTVLFENKESSKIVDIAEGPVSHAEGMMAQKGQTRQQPVKKKPPVEPDADNDVETTNKSTSSARS
jgi:pilus assembly protein CpaB